jgi:hypothetical protein
MEGEGPIFGTRQEQREEEVGIKATYTARGYPRGGISTLFRLFGPLTQALMNNLVPASPTG